MNWTDRIYGVDTGDALWGMIQRTESVLEVSSFSSDPDATSASGKPLMRTLLGGDKKTSVVVNVVHDGSNASAIVAGAIDAAKSLITRQDARTYRDVWPLTTKNERLKYYRTPNDAYGRAHPDRDGLMHTRWGAKEVNFGDIMHIKAYYSPDAGRNAKGEKVAQGMLTTANLTSNAYQRQLNVFYQTTNHSLVQEIKAVNDWVQGNSSMPAGLKHILLAGPNSKGEGQSPKAALLKAIRDSKKDVYIASATLSDPDLVQELKAAKKRGVNVVVGANKSDDHSAAAVTSLANEGVTVKTGGRYNHANILVADGQGYFGSLRDSKNAMKGLQTEFMFKAPAWDKDFAGFLKKTIDQNFTEIVGQGKTTVYAAILNDVAPVKGQTFRLVIDPTMSAKTKEHAKAMGLDLSRSPSLGVSIAASLREEAGDEHRGIPAEAIAFDRAAGLNTWGLDTESPWSLWSLVGPQMGNRGPIDTALMRVFRDVDATLAPALPGQEQATPITDVFSNTWDLTNNLVANVGGFYMLTKPFLRQWANFRQWMLKGFEGMAKSDQVLMGGFEVSKVGKGYMAVGRSFHNFVALVTEELMLPIANDLGLGDVVHKGIVDLRTMDGRTFAAKRADLYDEADKIMREKAGWKILSTAGIGRIFEAYSLEFWGGQIKNLGESTHGLLVGDSAKLKNGFVSVGRDFATAWDKVLGVTASEGQMVKRYTWDRVGRAGMAVGIGALYANQVYGEISAAQRSTLPIQMAFEGTINQTIKERDVRMPIHVFKRAGLAEWADRSPVHAIAGVGWYYLQKPLAAVVNTYEGIKQQHFLNANQRSLREAVAGEGIWRKAALLNTARFMSRESQEEDYQTLHAYAQRAMAHDPYAAMQLVIEAELAAGTSPLKNTSSGRPQWSIAAQFSILPMVATITGATTHIGNLQTFSFGVQGPVALSLGASLVSPIGLIDAKDPLSGEDLPWWERMTYVPNTVTEAALKFGLLAGAGEGVDWLMGKAGIKDDNWMRVSGRMWSSLLTLPLRFSTRALGGVGTIFGRIGQQERILQALGVLELGDTEEFFGRHWVGREAKTIDLINNAFAGQDGVNRARYVQDLIAEKLGQGGISGIHVDDGAGGFKAIDKWEDLSRAVAIDADDKAMIKKAKAARTLHAEITRQLPSYGAYEMVKHDVGPGGKLETYKNSKGWIQALRYGKRAGVVASAAIVGFDVAVSAWGQFVSESDAAKTYQTVNNFMARFGAPGQFIAQVYNVDYANHPVFKQFQDMVGKEFADPAKFNQHDANLYGLVGRWFDNLKRIFSGAGAYFDSGNKFKGTSFAGMVWDRVDDQVLAWTKSYAQPSIGGVFSLSYAYGLAGTQSDLDFQNRLSQAVASGVGNPLSILSEVYNVKNNSLAVGKMWHQDSARYQMGYSGQLAMRQRELVSSWALRNNNAADVARYFYVTPRGVAEGRLDWSFGFEGSRLIAKTGFWSGGWEGLRDGQRITQLIQGALGMGATGEAPEIDTGAVYDAPGGPFDRAQGMNALLEHNMAIYGDKAMLWTIGLTSVPLLAAGAWVAKQAWSKKLSPAKLFEREGLLNITSHQIPNMAVVGIDPLGGGAYQIADSHNPVPRYQFYTVVLGDHFYTFGDQGVHATDPFKTTRGTSPFPQGINRSRFQNVLRSLSSIVGSPGKQIVGTAHALDDLQKGKFTNLKAALSTVVKSGADLQEHMTALAREAGRAHTAHKAYFRGSGASQAHIDSFLDPLKQVKKGTQEMLAHVRATDMQRMRLELMLDELTEFTDKLEADFADEGRTPTNIERNARLESWMDEEWGQTKLSRRKAMEEALQEIHLKHVELVDGRRSVAGGLRMTLAERWGLKRQKHWQLREIAGRKVIAASGWDATRETLKKLVNPLPYMDEWRRDMAAVDTAKKVSRTLMNIGSPVVGAHANSLEEVVARWARQSGSAANYANWTVDDFLKYLTYHEVDGMKGWAELARAHRQEVSDMLEKTKYVERSRKLVMTGAATWAGHALVGNLGRLAAPFFALNQAAALAKPLQAWVPFAVAADETYSDDYRRLAMEHWEREKWDQLSLVGVVGGGLVGRALSMGYAANRAAGLGKMASLKAIGSGAWTATRAGTVSGWYSMVGGMRRAATVARRNAALAAGRGVMYTAAKIAPRAIAGLARFGLSAVGRVGGAVGGTLVSPLVGTILGMVVGEQLINTFVMPHVDRWADAQAEKARKWETELPTGFNATVAKLIGNTLMGWQAGVDYLIGRNAAELSKSKNLFARSTGNFLGILQQFLSPMNSAKTSFWFYQPEAPGVSVSLKDQRLRMSPLWHGNLKDAIDSQLNEQDQLMLGSHQDFIRSFFHESLFGGNQNRSSIMLNPPDRPETWNELGPRGLIFGESTMYALNARALASQPLYYGMRRRDLAKRDYVLSADVETVDSGYMMGIPLFQRGRVLNVTPYSRHTYNLSDSVTGEGPKSIILPGSIEKLFQKMGARVSSGFGNRTHPKSGEANKHHGGIDIAFSGSDKRFFSPMSGKVAWVGAATGFGSKTVIIRSGEYDILLGHNAAVHVQPGQEIKPGQLLVTAGADGVSTGIHVHFEVRKHEKGKTFWQQKQVDPEKFFNGSQKNYYKEIIRQEAIRQGVDPRWAISLTKQESNFNPNVKSHAGAVGLMQVMPKYWSHLLKPGEDLMDPRVNARIGVTVWKEALKAAGGNIPKALAIYNAGVNRVRKSEETGVPLPEETRNYVPKVIQHFREEGQFWGADTAPKPQAVAPKPKSQTPEKPKTEAQKKQENKVAAVMKTVRNFIDPPAEAAELKKVEEKKPSFFEKTHDFTQAIGKAISLSEPEKKPDAEKKSEPPEKPAAAPKKAPKKTKVSVSAQRLPEETVMSDNQQKRKSRRTDFILGYDGSRPYVQAQAPDGSRYRSMWDNNASGSSVEEALFRR